MNLFRDQLIPAFRNPALRGMWFLVLFVLPLTATALIVGETQSVERESVHGTVTGVHSMDGKRGPTTRTLRVRLDSGEQIVVAVTERTRNRVGERVRLQRIDHFGGWSRTTYKFEDYE